MNSRPGHSGPVNPHQPIHRAEPPKTVQHSRPSHLDNPYTKGHLHDSQGRLDQVRRGHQDDYRRVSQNGNHFRDQHRSEFLQRQSRVQSFYRNQQYHYYYSAWYRHGFYGGFYYPVRPYLEINNYFYYPVVNWLWDDTYDEGYYRDWYPDYDQYPVHEFEFAGIFYPTDTLRDCAIEVSAMSSVKQAHFRQGMTQFVHLLIDGLNANLETPVEIDRDDVVINHYQNLQDKAIVFEGFVDTGSVSQAFKALIDIEDPSRTLVFVPTTQDPNDQDLAVLDQMNQRIIELGGNPLVADQEPTNAKIPMAKP